MRYAKALLRFAIESGVEDRVYREVNTWLDCLGRLPQLRQTLDNPVLPNDTKLELFVEAAGGDVSDELKRFVRLVLRERREKYLQYMLLSYADLYRRQKNICMGRLTTVHPVSEAVLERMRTVIAQQTHGTVELDTRTDARLEGGFVLEIDTYRLDASVANQVKKIKQQFIEKNRRIV